LSAKKRGLKKSEFLKKEASPAVKKAASASLVIFAVLAVLVATATVITNSIAVFDLPIVSMAIDADDRDELEDELDAAADKLEDVDDLLEEIEEEYGKDVFKKTKKVINSIENATRKMSLNNVIALFNTYEDWVDEIDEDVAEKVGLNEVIEEVEEVSSILKIVRIVTYVFAVIVILLALWAAMGKKTGLSILCLILYVPGCALLSNVPIALICFVGFIALAVTTSRVNKAWKTA
jgi:small-conductance mechanosensitive channel